MVMPSSETTHQGKPHGNGKQKPYGHGWFMIVNPKNLRIVSVSCVRKPEGNEVAKSALLNILPIYKRVNCFVLHRSCALLPRASRNPAFKQIKYWAIDKFHAQGHKKTCRCNPLHTPRIAPLGKTGE